MFGFLKYILYKRWRKPKRATKNGQYQNTGKLNNLKVFGSNKAKLSEKYSQNCQKNIAKIVRKI